MLRARTPLSLHNTIIQFFTLVLVADDASDDPDRGFEYPDIAAVTHPPDNTLGVGRHQFPVPPRDLSIVAYEQDGVI
jgi:hypothetical protein